MIKSTDLYMKAFIDFILEDIRENEFLVDDILSDVTEDPFLNEVYGQKEVEKFKRFLKKDIVVNLEQNIDLAQLPCIAIEIGGGTEDTSKTGDALSDGYRQETEDVLTLQGALFSPTQVKAGPTTPILYDQDTGTVTFASNVDLSKVYEGMVIYNTISKRSYPIQLVLNANEVLIEEGTPADFNNVIITVKPQSIKHIRRFIPFYEDVTFKVSATSAVECLYLYMLVVYMIGRHKFNFFENKNYKISTIRYTPLMRILDNPNVVYERQISLSGKVEMSFIEATSLPVVGLNPALKIAGMTKTPAAFAGQAKAQGWESPED